MDQEEKSWEGSLVDGRIANILRAMKLSVPLKHQIDSIKRLVCRRDVLLATGTGTGKTLAYVIPSLQYVLQYQTSQNGGDHKLQCLIVEPTKELMLQTAHLLISISKQLAKLDVYINVTYSGQAGGPGGPDIVVTTPAHVADFEYEDLIFLSIDEADQIFAFEYKQQLERLITVIPQNCVKCLTSATLSRQVEDYGALLLTEPLIIQEDRYDNNLEQNKRFFFTTHQSDIERYYQLFAYFALNVLSGQRTIIYTPFVVEGFRLHYFLNRFGTKALLYSPHFPEQCRQNTLNKFNSFTSNVLIISQQQIDGQTEAGAIIGIDFNSVSVVILFSVPNSVNQFTHIVGRAGRGGNKATIISHLFDLDESSEQYTTEQLREWERQKVTLQGLLDAGVTMDYLNFDIEALKRDFGYRVKDVWSQMRGPDIQRYKQQLLKELLLEDQDVKKYLQQHKRDQELLRRDVRTAAQLAQRSLATIPAYLQQAAAHIKAQLQGLARCITDGGAERESRKEAHISYKQRSKLLAKLQSPK